MWKDDYLLGVDHIDEQHRSLFSKTEELITLVEDGVEKNKPAIIEIIVFLKGYALSHFRSEQEYQESIKYEDMANHLTEHKAFIKTVLKHEQILLASDFEEENVKSFTETLASWLVNHVAGSDQLIVGKKALN